MNYESHPTLDSCNKRKIIIPHYMLFPYFILNPLIILLIVLFPQIIFKFLALLIIGVLSACASRIILLIMETIIASVMKIPKKRGWVANSLVSFIQAVNIGLSESLSKVAIPDFAISNWRGKMLEVMWQTMYQVPKLADCLNGQVDKNPLLLYVYLTWVKTLSPQKWEEYVLTNLWWATELQWRSPQKWWEGN